MGCGGSKWVQSLPGWHASRSCLYIRHAVTMHTMLHHAINLLQTCSSYCLHICLHMQIRRDVEREVATSMDPVDYGARCRELRTAYIRAGEKDDKGVGLGSQMVKSGQKISVKRIIGDNTDDRNPSILAATDKRAARAEEPPVPHQAVPASLPRCNHAINHVIRQHRQHSSDLQSTRAG